MAQRRSNASLQLRQQLASNYCNVNDVLSSLKIERYFSVARELYQQAAQCYEKARTSDPNELDRAYIFLRRFVTLIVDKLPRHASWHLPQHKQHVLWARQAGQIMLTQLEEVAALMDAREDAKAVVSIDDMLADEFDNDGTSVEETSPTSIGPSGSATPSGALSPSRDIFAALRLPEAPSPVLPPLDNPSAYPGSPEGDALDSMEAEDCGSSDIRFAGVTTMDLEILRRIYGLVYDFAIRPPMRGNYTITLSTFTRKAVHQLDRDDFHVSFAPYLEDLPIELQMARPAVETNRCFFIHLGVAMVIHPFALQVAFRNAAKRYMMTAAADDIASSVLPSLLEYAGFVDANALSFVWPVEFNTSRICFVSGNDKKPMFTCFVPEGQEEDKLRDVIIHCDGSHFTLLRPKTSANTGFAILNQLLADARKCKCVVHVHFVRPSFSIRETLQSLQIS